MDGQRNETTSAPVEPMVSLPLERTDDLDDLSPQRTEPVAVVAERFGLKVNQLRRDISTF